MIIEGVKIRKIEESTWKIRYINRPTDEDIISKYEEGILLYLFDEVDYGVLSKEIIVLIGRKVDDNTNDVGLITKGILDCIDKFKNEFKQGDDIHNLNTYYRIFEPLKYRKMKINKILSRN